MSNETGRVTRKLKAILSADVKGYSLLMTNDEVQTIETLKKYRSLMSDLIQQHYGRVVDNPGDNLLAEFPSAVDAVETAVQIQNRLKKENAKFVEDKRLQFRIGVNIGDVVHDGDRIYGDGVNIAARIEGLADAGGICISRNAYDHVKNKLQVDTKYIGEHQVKNIKEPVRVYKVLLDTDHYTPVIKEKLELPEKPSIAVLPFTNMSGDPSQEYFSDGLTEQIINGLCKVSNLFVIARNSSFAYKGKAVSIKQIAKELGVKYILEGSVQKAGNRVRITAQLIDALSDFHMWSENYDRDLEDIFALQDEITVKLIFEMQVQLTLGEQARLWEGDTKNIKAYDKFVRGVEQFFHYNKKGNKQARRFLKDAIKIDNDYSLACAVLGISHIYDLGYGWTESSIESFAEAEKWAKRAREINESLDFAYMLLGIIHVFKREFDEAIKMAEHSIELNPNGADAHSIYALILCCSGKPEKAINYSNMAIRLNPKSNPMYYDWLSLSYRMIGQYEKAIEYAKKSIALAPESQTAHIMLTSAYSLSNNMEQAKFYAKQVLEIHPNFSLEYYKNLLPYKDQNAIDIHIEALRKAGLPD